MGVNIRFRKCCFVYRMPICNSFGTRSYSRKNPEANTKNYKHTIILPKTKFPLRYDSSKRVEMDSFLYEKCNFASLYEWQRTHSKGKEFVLHDGPPYANGKPHMGHAINKILKDITIRRKLLEGHRVHYVPGWDCHGLPIEHKALSRAEMNDLTLSPIEIRNTAREFAKEAIADQRAVFTSWGIMANWDKCYFTFDKKYIKNQLRQFLKLYEMGFIYQDVKPVFWSPSSRTALAEAELEYYPAHRSTAVTVRFSMATLPDSVTTHAPGNVSALVWTTTPWTLPANQAICFNPNLSYCLVSIENSREHLYILAAELVGALQEKLEGHIEIITTFSGNDLRGLRYQSPYSSEKLQPFLPANHVTTAKGTGLVHTAPAHGPDDFIVALEHNMPITCLVDETGCYTPEAGPELQGLFVLHEGNARVLEMLTTNTMHLETLKHSYPYDWRTKQPVILRASQQWFIDTNAIKKLAIEKLQDISIFPEKGGGAASGGGLITQLERRPYWCISRQRVWGVPIPVLYHRQSRKPIVSRSLIDHYCDLLDQFGSDFWWTLPQEELVTENLLEEHGISLQDVERGKDILDIWFDSGISWSAVLGEEKVADLYLEGVDQFTGWFQSSLMTSVAVRGQAPYKAVFVHGFAVDKNGQKMSKSLGNVVNPQEITHGGSDISKQPAFGVDVLRWWVACHATQHANVAVSQHVLQSSADSVHKIRIVLRFLLGALHDFTLKKETELSQTNLYFLDHYMLHLLWDFEQQIKQMYESYQYHRVCKTITNFVTNEVSALYCHLTKDRLYCESKENSNRLACQFVLKKILETVSQNMAPILPYLAEEVYLHHPCKKDESFLFYSEVQNTLPDWAQPEVVHFVNTALEVKRIINKTATITNTCELDATVFAGGDSLHHLQTLAVQGQLTELLQVSSVSLVEGSRDEALHVQLMPAANHVCGRCRRYFAQHKDKLCSRCQHVVSLEVASLFL